MDVPSLPESLQAFVQLLMVGAETATCATGSCCDTRHGIHALVISSGWVAQPKLAAALALFCLLSLAFPLLGLLEFCATDTIP